MPATQFADRQVNSPDPPDNNDDSDHGDANNDNPTRWIIIATFWSSPEAHLARLKLESENIDCQIENENIVATDFLLAPAVGGIKILVPDFEAAHARDILNQSIPPTDDTPPVEFASCPDCGSHNIHRPFLQVKTFWASVVCIVILGPLAPVGLALFLIFWRPWVCRECENVFVRNDGQQGFPVLNQTSISR